MKITNNEINYKEVLDNLECPIYVTDSSGVTQYVNRAYLAENPMWVSSQLIGHNVYEILEEGNLFVHAVTPAVLQGKKESFQLLSHPLLPEKSAFVSGRPIYDRHNALKHVVSILYVDSFFQRLHSHFNYPLRQICSLEKKQQDRPTNLAPPPIQLIGQSEPLRVLRTLIGRIAPANVPVLISGESGTGKEVLADAIQQRSLRANKPFVKVNCAAIPFNLLESELFGYDRGAFTGAMAQGKAGFFEQANGGTLFLDEIGELPPESQAKLLRVLQHQEVQRLGSTRTLSLDVRVIAATNACLLDKIEQRQFRSDLYYRLNTISLQLPPLRERAEDIPLLIGYFSTDLDLRYQRIIRFSPDAVIQMKHYAWPGNVRELRNLLEYMYVCSEDNYVDSEAIDTWFRQNGTPATQQATESYATNTLNHVCRSMLSANMSLKSVIDETEKCILLQLLDAHENTYTIAKRLGVAQPTIVRKLQRYNLRAKQECE